MKIPRINIDKIRKTKNVDYTFVAVVLILLAYGLIMVFSASSASAHYRMNDTFYFIKRQALWAFLGLGGMAFFSSVPYKFYYKHATKILAVAIVLLVAVLTPLGVEVNGAQRWLGFGPFTFQPSEFAKFALIIFLSKSLADNSDIMKSSWGGFALYMAIIAVVAGLVIIEPHMSGAVLIAGVGVILLFVAGAKWSHLSVVAVVGVIGMFILAIVAP